MAVGTSQEEEQTPHRILRAASQTGAKSRHAPEIHVPACTQREREERLTSLLARVWHVDAHRQCTDDAHGNAPHCSR